MRCAVVEKTWSELRIRELSWPRRSESALKTWPPLLTSCFDRHAAAYRARAAAGRRSRANGGSSPIAAEKSGAAALERERRLLHPGLEGRPGLGVEGAEDLVELDRVRRPGPCGSVAALRQRRVRPRCRGSARRRSRRAASSGAASPGCSPGSARTAASISIVASARPSSASSMLLTLPTETPEIRTSDSTASCVASLKGTVNSVAFGVQRHRAAEARPRGRAPARSTRARRRPRSGPGWLRRRACSIAAALAS